jgi:hypothetical protein
VTNQNPVMSMIDANGNRLVVTSFGITGTVAPVLPASSTEGTAVVDGTVTWKVVGADSQGFRVFPLPGAAGPVFQVIPYYQMKAPTLAALATLINPIPDDYSRVFQRGMEAYCLQASPNPGDKERGYAAEAEWIKAMVQICKQGDREPEAYAMLPAESPVEGTYQNVRNPQDPSQPF